MIPGTAWSPENCVEVFSVLCLPHKVRSVLAAPYESPGGKTKDGIYYEGQAADSLCTVIAFFCSNEHLDDWSAERASLNGHRLSLGEALEVGKALFQPVLFDSGSYR